MLLIFWTITENPRDASALAEGMGIDDKMYVIRPHAVGQGWTTPLHFCKASTSLESLREMMRAKGLNNVGRHPGDDPVILETWV